MIDLVISTNILPLLPSIFFLIARGMKVKKAEWTFIAAVNTTRSLTLTTSDVIINRPFSVLIIVIVVVSVFVNASVNVRHEVDRYHQTIYEAS